jgi:hypothetical protein
MTNVARHLRACTALAACLGIGSPALSQEFQPYPAPQITAQQWATYAEQVRQIHGDTVELLVGQNLVAFSDMGTRTFYIFTTKDHPAHPAWITRQLFEEGGEVRVRQIGYFAGSEPEFAKLFADYQKRNTQLMEDVQRRNR